MAKIYDHKQIEAKWKEMWGKQMLNLPPTAGQHDDFKVQNRLYVLGMFPYPSGEGLHTGHVRIFAACDVLARYYRSKGKDVLLPMGWDAFGLPAENAAIKAKTNPMDIVPEREKNFMRQMEMMGLSFDWGRQMSTAEPDYYQWTQWIFSKLYQVKNEQGERLVYRQDVAINWCPFCKTGLANEEVLGDGTHERCGTKVVQKQMKQWMMRISEYGDRLLDNLIHYDWVDSDGGKHDKLDWPEGILAMQREWIGRSEGARVRFKISDLPAGRQGLRFQNEHVDVFTTRLDTIFGVTFVAISPEAYKRVFMDTTPLSPPKLGGEARSAGVVLAAKEYVEQALNKTEQQRLEGGKDKTGVDTGLRVINPVNGEEIPVWVADYVLGSVGTGAVMGVPGADVRDMEFAKKYGIEVKQVVKPDDSVSSRALVACLPAGRRDPSTSSLEATSVGMTDKVFSSDGILINSGDYTGITSTEARQKLTHLGEQAGWAENSTTYHLRDWIFSRQRYWGEPFPLIYCDKCGDENGVVLVPETELPVELPKLDSYEPSGTGESPLSTADEWVKVKCPVCGGEARRETDTMPNWAGSCWYFLYFALSKEVREKIRSMSSRAKSADLADEVEGSLQRKRDSSTAVGMTGEAVGMTGGEARSAEGVSMTEIWNEVIRPEVEKWLPVDWYLGGAEHAVLHLLYARFWMMVLSDLKLISWEEPFLRLRSVGMVLAADGRKMSKSWGNVVNPDDMVAKFGADATRLYEMFMGPWDQAIAWDVRSLSGCYRLVERLWKLSNRDIEAHVKQTSRKLKAKLLRTIVKIDKDTEKLKFNTAVAALMELLNVWQEKGEVMSVEEMKKLLVVVSVYAPFVAEELYQTMGFSSVCSQLWPEVDMADIKEETVTLAVQVNGRLRATLILPAEQAGDQEAVVRLALQDKNVAKWVGEKEPQVIFVPGRVLNLVI